MNEDKSIEPSDKDTISEKTGEEIAEEQSLVETAKVLRELRMTVQKLRLEGVSMMAIHEFIGKQKPLSRMIITPDYRIFLPDYNDMEIEMGALPKAIYFLYLRLSRRYHLQAHAGLLQRASQYLQAAAS